MSDSRNLMTRINAWEREHGHVHHAARARYHRAQAQRVADFERPMGFSGGAHEGKVARLTEMVETLKEYRDLINSFKPQVDFDQYNKGLKTTWDNLTKMYGGGNLDRTITSISYIRTILDVTEI